MNITNSSISDNGNYPYIVQQAVTNDNVFNTFKSHVWYTPILEHVSYDIGFEYLEIIKNDYPFLLNNIDKYKTNDNIGSPITYNYTDVGNVSPTTLRYVKVLGEISEHFGGLDNLDVVEIGCGYGGQAKLIFDTYEVKSYTFIDLPCVLELTKKYLSVFNIDMSKLIFKDITSLTENEKYDLFISNYAYTECSESIRETYFKNVLSNSKMGYLTSNFLSRKTMNDEIISKLKNCFVIEERPKTGDDNFIIIWK
jgi:hypothetical protein